MLDDSPYVLHEQSMTHLVLEAPHALELLLDLKQVEAVQRLPHQRVSLQLQQGLSIGIAAVSCKLTWRIRPLMVPMMSSRCFCSAAKYSLGNSLTKCELSAKTLSTSARLAYSCNPCG